MFTSFARPKPCSIIVKLKDTNSAWHLSKLAKETNTTYVYVTRFVTRLESEGFVTIEANGKKRVVRLTDKGMVVANSIEELRKRFEK